MTSARVGVSGESGTLSPPPPSRALALSALLVAVIALVTIAVLGGAATTASQPGSAGQAIGFAFSSVGLVLAGVILWMAIRSVRASVLGSHQLASGEVLAARAHADRSRQDALVTFGLSFALAIVVSLVLVVMMNDGSIQKTFLRWDLMYASAFDVVKAFGLNIWIAVIAEIFVLIFGLLLAVARMAPGRAGKPIRALAVAYIDIMRAVPAIIVLYLVGFGLPLAKIPLLSGLSSTGFAILALTLTYSAYVAETYRAGIEAVHPSQGSASRSLGFSFGQTLRYVILPQAVRFVIPPLLSAFIALQKDTSLVNIIGALDAFNQAKFYASSDFNLSSVTVVAVLFIIITIPQTRFVDWTLARGAMRRRGGTK